MTKMHARALFTAAALAATLCAGAAHAAEYDCTLDGDVGTPAEKARAYEVYIDNVEAALGRFDDIEVYRETPEKWERVSGKYIPIEVDDEPVAHFQKNMPSDRPMMLPTDFTGWEGGDGGSVPYAVVGRMPGSNPEVQWVFLHRHYKIKNPVKAQNPSDEAFDVVRDVAVIGHHPRTGATAFLQFYNPECPKPVPTIVSPFDRAEGREFWNSIQWLATIDCAQCHSSDPFIHSPWIDQVRVDDGKGPGYHEPLVPSNPLGPYYVIGAVAPDGAGHTRDLFGGWYGHLVHLEEEGNVCTGCHRIAPSDTVGLYPNSTHGIGIGDRPYDTEAYEKGRKYQTEMYRKMAWMPPVNVLWSDFYQGQEDLTDKAALERYMERYGDSVKTVNAIRDECFFPDPLVPMPVSHPPGDGCARDPRLVDIPRPPALVPAVLANRDRQDTIGPGQSLLVVDTRMRANTDGSLHEWRFAAGDGAGGTTTAAPVVLRSAKPGSESFEIVFVGEPQEAGAAGAWTALSGEGDVALAEGDFLGLLLTNGGEAEAPALVPHSDDRGWAAVTGPDGATSFPFGVVTYSLSAAEAPAEGETVTVKDPAYRTYAFEFRNRL